MRKNVNYFSPPPGDRWQSYYRSGVGQGGGQTAVSTVIKQPCEDKEILCFLQQHCEQPDALQIPSPWYVTHPQIPSDTSSPLVSQPLASSTCPVHEPDTSLLSLGGQQQAQGKPSWGMLPWV